MTVNILTTKDHFQTDCVSTMELTTYVCITCTQTLFSNCMRQRKVGLSDMVINNVVTFIVYPIEYCIMVLWNHGLAPTPPKCT